ncbi:peptidoglycan-binding domain-containing protein [Falsiroseomonas sp. E2-1-a4]|uniref:peptidoglycan-binding domain-containing protein n=1 Tax=Falsiroseomonas sp. E2-1-a4 TaxID=3239299 RepID=UPI003F342C81
MKLSGLAFSLALGTQLALTPAHSLAQPAQPLTYAQPLERDAVVKVQEALRRAGAYTGAADGIWGPASRTALETFQQGRGLQATGEMNPATAATLGVNPAELLPAHSAPPATTEVLSEQVVRNVQTRLRSLGFYEGGVDGIWGPATQTAIERFQQSRSLQVTGQLTPVTASAMGLDPNNLAGAPR